jgi:hypothetical protein
MIKLYVYEDPVRLLLPIENLVIGFETVLKKGFVCRNLVFFEEKLLVFENFHVDLSECHARVEKEGTGESLLVLVFFLLVLKLTFCNLHRENF